ncbi:MAG: hypothetical protein ACRCWM_02390 [Sarcina sp.]
MLKTTNMGIEHLYAMELIEDIKRIPSKESFIYDMVKIDKTNKKPVYTILTDETIEVKELGLDEAYQLIKEFSISKSDTMCDLKEKCLPHLALTARKKHTNKILGEYINGLVASTEVNKIVELFDNQYINSDSVILCNETQLRSITALKDADGNVLCKKVKGVYYMLEIPILVIPAITSIAMVELSNLIIREIGNTAVLNEDLEYRRAGKVGIGLNYDYGLSLIDESRIVKVKTI